MRSRIHTYNLTVQEADLDELMHVNNVVYFSYLQAAAIEHWYSTVAAEISDSLRWIVKKHEIEYFKPAFLHDSLTVKTWIEAFGGVSSVRSYEIHREQDLIVRAQTQWIAVDPQSMKPKRLDISTLDSYFFEE